MPGADGSRDASSDPTEFASGVATVFRIPLGSILQI